MHRKESSKEQSYPDVWIEDDDINPAFFDDITGNEAELIEDDCMKQEIQPVVTMPSNEQQIPQTQPGQPHIFHEMAIVRKRLHFDEQEFRERVHESSLKISQEFKEIVVQLYDAVDKMVNEVSKALQQMQTEQYQEMDSKLATIRHNVIEAETMDQSIKKFLATIAQAFEQSFSNNPPS